ncbi:hypothetical protein B1F73_28300, partial [Pseudomonas syringae]
DQTNRGQDDAAIVRIEQLHPFPRAQLAAELKAYGDATDVVWCQEEPQNQGAWYQIRHPLNYSLAGGHSLHYAASTSSPSPAAGHMADHIIEQQKLVADALLNPFNDQVAE